MDFPKLEEKILKFWSREKIFEKSLELRAKSRKFVFYEGPPTANGMPGIHHVETRAFKDLILRYKTMKGYLVERRAGWDTHGLPVEIEVEKELGISSKPEIEKYGIAKFNKKCKESVWKYKTEWEKMTKRIGYWINLHNPYITYENKYIESLWWIIKKIWEKGLLYEDYKVVPYCARCGTPLSSHEVAQGYKNVVETSIYVKFKLKKSKNTYLLVWTTTPWTLPANVAIAANKRVNYVKVKDAATGDSYIVAEQKAGMFPSSKSKKSYSGKDLEGLEYESLYDFTKSDKKTHFVINADFVTTKEGTGLVHIAPAFGEDDLEAGKKNDLPVLMTVDMRGKFVSEVKPWKGVFVKDADKSIIDDLKRRKLLYKEEAYAHDYPFCWRCDSPLIYYARKSWFIRMKAVNSRMLENNEKINWIPGHIKHGRFGEWLHDPKDWAFSRDRYWGTPLPVWRCESCKVDECIGSIQELKERSKKKKIEDVHKPFIDNISLICRKCKRKMHRVEEVIDAWFDSGAMPFAQWHWPFENRDKLKAGNYYPADFICEGVDQTRGWFYTLLAIGTLMEKGAPYKNVISVGLVLDKNGKKMSKSKGNIIKPHDVISRFGADALRWYLYSMNQPWDEKRFSVQELEERLKKFISTFWNTFVFFDTYRDRKIKPKLLKNLPRAKLDKWILSKLNSLIKKITHRLENYIITDSAREIELFLDDLSNWYVRRSRRRFQKPRSEKEKKEAENTLFTALVNLCLIAGPFIPFMTEEIYKNLTNAQSVHLADYPVSQSKFINADLEKKMNLVRETVASGLKERALKGIKIRQPLAKMEISASVLMNDSEMLNLIAEEVNVKKVNYNGKLKSKIKLDTKITARLLEEGVAREVVRFIQQMRKHGGYKPVDKIRIQYDGSSDVGKIIEKWNTYILNKTGAKTLTITTGKRIYDVSKEINLQGENIWFGIKRI